jgi:peptide/nickel transport system permease protein
MTDLDRTGPGPDGDAVAVEQEPATPLAVPAAGPPAAVPAVRVRGGRDALYFALRNRKLLVGTTVILVLVGVAVFGPMLRHYGPNEYVGPPAQAPSSRWWFGTTFFGQDVFSQFANGLRSSLLVGLFGGGLAALIGMLVGFTAGYRGGLVDEVLSMVTNVVLVIPGVAVLVIAAAYLSVRGIEVEALFIGLTTWPWVARAVRAQTFSLRSRDFIDLARLSGMSGRKIILKEIAPNMSSYLLLVFILLFGGAVLIAATIEFIGLGPTEGMSLGLMMNNAVLWSALQLHIWWWFVPPGLGITMIVGALYVMNVGLDEVFNPRLRAL